MTGSEFYAYLLRTFRRTDKSVECYEAITDAIVDIKRAYPFGVFDGEAYTASLSTVGDYKLDLPSDFNHINGAVRINDGDNARTLDKLSKYDFDRLYPDPNAANVTKQFPLHYCIYGQQILVCPPVDKTTYVVEFSYSSEEEQEITSATTEVPFGTLKYRKMLLYGSLYYLFTTLENDEQASKYKQLYEQELAKHIQAEQDITDSPCIMDIHQF